MIDIRRLFVAMTQVLRDPDFPDADALAHQLDLNLSDARIGEQKSAMVIHGARLNGVELPLTGIICGILPCKEIWLFFENSGLSFQAIKEDIFGADQRLIPSKRSKGFGVCFEIDGLTCGYTASSPGGDVDSVFCKEPEKASREVI